MRLFLDTSIRWLIAAGMWLGAIAYFRNPNAIDLGSLFLNSGVAAMIVAGLVLMSAVALEGTNRCLLLLHCVCDPGVIKEWVADLDSRNRMRKRLALRTVADYLGGRFGVIGPWDWCRPEEIEAHVAVIKKLWAAKEATLPECPSQERLFPQLARNMKEAFWRLANCRVDWMISRIPEYFRVSRPATSEQPGWSTVENLLPDPLAPLDPARLIQAMQPRVTDALQKAAQVINDSPAGALIVDSEEPVGELCAQLLLEAYQVGLLLRLGSSEINPMELFSPGRGGFKKVCRDFAEMLDRIGAALKDGLMDLSFLEERVPPEALGDELPDMSAEEFIQAMRPNVEQALQHFIEITNQTPDGLILIAEETSVCRIFAKLHAQALETGLELRLRRAETLGLLGKSTRTLPSSLGGEGPGLRGAATPHLRKAASPPLPPPFLGWAEKYRCMRIAGTRFPLIHLGPEKSESADRPDEPHITSVKPGPGAI